MTARTSSTTSEPNRNQTEPKIRTAFVRDLLVRIFGPVRGIKIGQYVRTEVRPSMMTFFSLIWWCTEPRLSKVNWNFLRSSWMQWKQQCQHQKRHNCFSASHKPSQKSLMFLGKLFKMSFTGFLYSIFGTRCIRSNLWEQNILGLSSALFSGVFTLSLILTMRDL